MEKNSALIIGHRAIVEAINAGKNIEKIMVIKDLNNTAVQEVVQLANKAGVTVQKVPKEKIQRVAKQSAHQGMVAYASPIEFYDLDTKLMEITSTNSKPLILLLDGITDVRNFGAIARTAECVGVDLIVIPPKGNAPISYDAIKSSAGALLRVPISKTNIIDAIYTLQAYDINVVGATEKSEYTMYESNLRKATAIVMGNEEKGLSKMVLKQADELVKIPLAGDIASLNVSVAAAVMLYESIRQRQ